jgi:DnaJ-domain-containing protein 1
VDEYLRLRKLEEQHAGSGAGSAATAAPTSGSAAPALGGADLRAAQKEVAALERRLGKLQQQIDKARTALADHDQADYVGLGTKMEAISAQEREVEELETRWFELTEALG